MRVAAAEFCQESIQVVAAAEIQWFGWATLAEAPLRTG